MPTVLTSIRLPQELYEWLKDKAEKEHRTISNMLIAILIDEKDNEQKKCKSCKWFMKLEQDGLFIDWCSHQNKQGATATLWSCKDWESNDY